VTLAVDAAPRLTPAEAEAVAARHFGVSGEARRLTSERDQNFALRSAEGRRYVLKLANADESRSALEFQGALLERLAGAELGFEVPRVQPALDGRRLLPLQLAGRTHLARLLSWVPGEPLAEARTRPPALLRELGRCLGRLSLALDGFDHPGARRELRWDLRQAAGRRGALASVGDPARRELARRRIDDFEARLGPALDAQPPCVIHGDWHEHNVLLSPATEPERRVVGVVDFGDALLSRRVCDPAIAIAYVMLGSSEPLAAAAAVTAGFCESAPLAEAELELLFELARLRLVTSVLNAAEQAGRAPDNEYLRISEAPAWELLERLEGVSASWAHYRLRAAAGLEAHPRRGAVVAALEAQPDFGPVIGVTLRGAPVLDLGASSPDFEPPARL
jgi:Ser/Thr protein kinase RdoA (MazF antagonist)